MIALPESSSAVLTQERAMSHHPLSMTIVVRPPVISAMSTFAWSDFPVVQRDPLYESSTCTSSCCCNKKEKTWPQHDKNGPPELLPVCSSESDFSSDSTVMTTTDSSSAFTSSSSSSSPIKRVSFSDQVHVQRHSIVLGSHPSCPQLALELGWEHDEGEWVPLGATDDAARRRHTNIRRRSYFERKQLLKDIGGLTDEEIRKTTLQHAAPSIQDLSAMQGIVMI